ncbi:hypothetical protein BJX99DRAFT_228122 [Aspergillus californicus]
MFGGVVYKGGLWLGVLFAVLLHLSFILTCPTMTLFLLYPPHCCAAAFCHLLPSIGFTLVLRRGSLPISSAIMSTDFMRIALPLEHLVAC